MYSAEGVIQLRTVLQAQAMQADCPKATPQLAGISVAGWIVISVLIGLVTGVLSTLLYQRCCRRPKADAPPAAASTLYTPSSSLRLTPQGSSMNLHSKGPLNTATEPFFSPLRSSTQLVTGSLAAAASGLDVGKGSTPSGSDTGDTRLVLAQDQQPALLQMQALGSWRHQAPLHETLTVLPEGGSAGSSPDPYRYLPPSAYGPPSSRSTSLAGSSPGRPGSGGMGRAAAAGMHVTPGIGAGHTPGQQQYAGSSSAGAGAAGAGASIPQGRPDSSGMGGAGSQYMQQQRPPPLPLPPLPQQQQQEGAAGAPAPHQAAAAAASTTAGAAAAVSSPGARSEGLEGTLTPRSAVESEYEAHELDADWKALLGGVDRRLTGAGLPPLDARERAIAMRTLLAATHSRGADAAMQATVEEVVRFRAFQAARQQ